MRPSRLIHETIALRDGRTVVLRPIDPSDAERLIDLHNHLSFESQYFRFFGPKPQLTKAEAEYLANVDFHRRFAIVAQVDDNDIVGVGRFDVNEPGSAEAAIVVRDDYQHAGLGTAILHRMREVGRGAGLKSFTAEVLAENAAMLDLLRGNGLEVTPSEAGVVRVIAPIENQPVLFRNLKVVAEVAGALLPKRSSG
jgi:RimJ/RimL family protein N-acetyltransferase